MENDANGEDAKLAIEETNRFAQHEAIKSDVREEIKSRIARHAQLPDRGIQAVAAAIGEDLREKALGEVSRAETEIQRARVAARVSQVVDYIFLAIYGLISLEIVVELLGARESNAFKHVLDLVTAPLLAPFRTLLPDLTRGRYQLKVSYIFAMLVFALVHAGVNGLLRLFAHRKTRV